MLPALASIALASTHSGISSSRRVLMLAVRTHTKKRHDLWHDRR